MLLGTYHNIRVSCNLGIIATAIDVASQTSTCGNRYRHIDVVSYERT